MKQIRRLPWMFLATLMIVSIAAAADDMCAQLVREATAATELICTEAGQNQACYGHNALEAQPQAGFDSFDFNEAGDTVDVLTLKSLRMSPMNLETGDWGVALLRLQATTAGKESPENANILLFGDVEIENAMAVPVLVDVTVASRGAINVRRLPKQDGFVLATLPSGQQVTARGRLEDNSWLYIDMPDGGNGWVRSSLMSNATDFAQLNVLDPSMTQYGPMQAFYLQSGSDEAAANKPECSQVSDDGILIQTPEGVAEVRLWINEVKIRLGSTAFIQSKKGKQLKVVTIEGKAHVEAQGVETVAPAGTELTVPLTVDSVPAAPPSKPVAYTETTLQTLPIQALDREIEVAPPLEEEAIEEALIEDAKEQAAAALAEATEEPIVQEVIEIEPEVVVDLTEEPTTVDVTESVTTSDPTEETSVSSETDTPEVTEEPPVATEASATDSPTDEPTAEEPTPEASSNEPSGPVCTFDGTFVVCETPAPTEEPTATEAETSGSPTEEAPTDAPTEENTQEGG